MKQALQMDNGNNKPSGSKEEKKNRPPFATSQEAKTKEIGRILASIGDRLNSRVSPLQAGRRKWHNLQSTHERWRSRTTELNKDTIKKCPYASKFSWSLMNFLRSDDKVKNISCAIWMIVLNSCRRLNLIFNYRASGCNNFCNISKHKSNISKTSQEAKSKRAIFPEVDLMSWVAYAFSHTKTESRLLKMTLL